jgi:hypothetical protein
MRIGNHAGHIDPAAQAASFNSGQNVDPPFLNPGWQQGDHLWLAMYANGAGSSGNITEYPTGYSFVANGYSPGLSPHNAVVYRERNATSEDPTAFIAVTQTGGCAATIGIHTSGAGGRAWRLQSNATPGTTARMIVFTAATPPSVVAYEGGAVADVNGVFRLDTVDAGANGSKRFAVAHNWNNVLGTVSIFGGPGIAELLDNE